MCPLYSEVHKNYYPLLFISQQTRLNTVSIGVSISGVSVGSQLLREFFCVCVFG